MLLDAKKCKMKYKYGVLRVTNARLWFLEQMGSFGPLSSDTYSTDDREIAYQKARSISGLMVELPKSGFVPKLPMDRPSLAQQSSRTTQNEPNEPPHGSPQANERANRRLELTRSLRDQVEACLGRSPASRLEILQED